VSGASERTHLAPGDLVSIAQAQQLLPISKGLMLRLTADGLIPHIRVRAIGSRRGRVLIERAGLERYVASLRQPAAPLQVKVSPDGILANLRARGVGRSG